MKIVLSLALLIYCSSQAFGEFGNTVLKTRIEWKDSNSNIQVDTFFVVTPGESNFQTNMGFDEVLQIHFENQIQASENHERIVSIPTKTTWVEIYVFSRDAEIKSESLPHFYAERSVAVDQIMAMEVLDKYIIGGLDGIAYLWIDDNYSDSVYRISSDTLYSVIAPNRVSFDYEHDGMLEYADYYTIYTYDDDLSITDSLIASLASMEDALFSAIYVYRETFVDIDYPGFDIYSPIEEIPEEVRHIYYLVRGYHEHLQWSLKELSKNGFTITWQSGI